MKRVLLFAAPLLIVGLLYFARGPYFFPTSTALGPCFKDWTSPSSYMSRASPLRSVDMDLGDAQARLCYGAPSSNGRRLFGQGGVVPDGLLWRMGANEPTRLFVDGPVTLGSLRLEPGRYSLYAQTGQTMWRIFATQSTRHWGNMISSGVRAQEVGSFEVPRVRLGGHVEELTFSHADDTLTMAWGFTRIHMPLAAAE
ncbi:MAG: DUF2911 domain-containing protein [Rhodothermales bacterium]|nr:DUF2911 domain-containing protein [Rhodothermales bacterium]MBO6779222.1 DUF2911 domain-containing protein [Rhodothermales bacterium]